MASTKKKNAIRQPIKKTFIKRSSVELPGEIEDMRLGMERRKFSYTIHIPERRSGQNHKFK